jgi:hypothetical protein
MFFFLAVSLSSTVNPVNGMTMGDLYQRTIEKKRYLEGQGYVPLHCFDGMFFFLGVSLSWNDTDGIGS